MSSINYNFFHAVLEIFTSLFLWSLTNIYSFCNLFFITTDCRIYHQVFQKIRKFQNFLKLQFLCPHFIFSTIPVSQSERTSERAVCLSVNYSTVELIRQIQVKWSNIRSVRQSIRHRDSLLVSQLVNQEIIPLFLPNVDDILEQ